MIGPVSLSSLRPISPGKSPSLSEPPQARLTFLCGEQKGEVIFLRIRRALFGRTQGILLRDALASRQHMQIYFDGNNYILEDLNSSNGTFLNGAPVLQPVPLKNGDTIRIGATRFRFELAA